MDLSFCRQAQGFFFTKHLFTCRYFPRQASTDNIVTIQIRILYSMEVGGDRFIARGGGIPTREARSHINIFYSIFCAFIVLSVFLLFLCAMLLLTSVINDDNHKCVILGNTGLAFIYLWRTVLPFGYQKIKLVQVLHFRVIQRYSKVRPTLNPLTADPVEALHFAIQV